ncbi:MAG: glycosyltransferase family 4 protein [Dehalococcoidia bacterium]|nr:glycosyltransferase family 4 protein [Dehalococcoidia bacterium]
MTSPLRVLLNASAVPRQPAGAGIYTLELARALAQWRDVEVTVAAPGIEVEGTRRVLSPRNGPLVRSLWEQTRMPRLLREVDVYHGAHFSVPLRAGVGRVATVHDLTFYRLPRRYAAHRRWYYRGLAQLSRRADRVIVPSGVVASDVVRFLGYPPERIRVVPEAARSGLCRAGEPEVAALCSRLGVEPGYLLCLGTAEPGKRAVDAIRAIALLRTSGEPHQLVLAGNEGRLSDVLRREAARLGVEHNVRFVGYVAETDLAALYTGALALVFPSLYEGFGLPPLEALACGTPVIATKRPAMTEVLADGALFVPAHDPKAIAAQVARLAADAAWREEWSQRGKDVHQHYSWTRAAEETVEVYREVAR